jgi:hypothetical protein
MSQVQYRKPSSSKPNCCSRTFGILRYGPRKYDEANDRWQARVNRGSRFYFKVEDDTYFITELIPHPRNDRARAQQKV